MRKTGCGVGNASPVAHRGSWNLRQAVDVLKAGKQRKGQQTLPETLSASYAKLSGFSPTRLTDSVLTNFFIWEGTFLTR